MGICRESHHTEGCLNEAGYCRIFHDFCRVPLPFESMRTSPFSMFGTWLILICPVGASRRSVLEVVVTVSRRVLS